MVVVIYDPQLNPYLIQGQETRQTQIILLPFYGCGRFWTYIIHYPINAFYTIYYCVGYLL